MIDPFKIPDVFTQDYLEEFILFSICVANKPALRTAEKLDGFLKEIPHKSPFFAIGMMIATHSLDTFLKKHRMGQYKRISKAFRQVTKLDLKNLTVESLESVHGIGPKTARLIMLYLKPNSGVVPLDTHVLKFLGELGYTVPKSTPTGKRYEQLEAAFVAEAVKRNMTVKQLDTVVWQTMASNKKIGATS